MLLVQLINTMKIFTAILTFVVICHTAQATNRTNPCDRLDCGSGICRTQRGRPVCVYPTGSKPETTTGVDPCNRIECGPGVCEAQQGKAVCNCPPGYRFDSRITTCVPNDAASCPPCGIHECGLFPPGVTPYTCPRGYQKDRCGCVSGCFCEGCPSFNSNLQCPFGYRTDRNGCPISQCVDDPTRPPMTTTPPMPPTPPTPPIPPTPPNCPAVCPIRECGLFFPVGSTPYRCPNGYRNDSCGCMDQDCQCAGCPHLERINCPYGYRTRRGCPVGICIERPNQPPLRCPRSGEPAGTLGNFCSTSQGCDGNLICCFTERGGPHCVAGIPLRTPQPALRCPTVQTSTPSRPCSRSEMCPSGEVCCSSPIGSPGPPSGCFRGVSPHSPRPPVSGRCPSRNSRPQPVGRPCSRSDMCPRGEVCCTSSLGSPGRVTHCVRAAPLRGPISIPPPPGVG